MRPMHLRGWSGQGRSIHRELMPENGARTAGPWADKTAQPSDLRILQACGPVRPERPGPRAVFRHELIPGVGDVATDVKADEMTPSPSINPDTLPVRLVTFALWI